MALTPTARQTPAGKRLKNGYQSLITFAVNPTLSLWEMGVKPFGMDGGPMINTATMHNVVVEQKAAGSLIEITDGTMKVAFDPKVIDQLYALLNVETTITQKWPDGSKLVTYGALIKIDFDEMVNRTMPTATVTFGATCTDPATGAEVLPDHVTAAGTT